jgi:adenylyl-sulfate kinase
MLWHTEGFVVWLTGLPGSGKTTLARSLHHEFKEKGLMSEILDGDEIRKNISPEIGFSRMDREEHSRRVAYIGKLLSRNGIATIVSLISPFRSSRGYARSIIPRFVEVWVNCSLETCRKRDLKGLYDKAAKGEILNLTGVQDPYEPPLSPEILINTDNELVDKSKNTIIKYLLKKNYVWVEENDNTLLKFPK